MRFHEKLAKELKSSKEERKILPRSYNILGDILIIKLDRSLLKKKKKIGNAILNILPYVRSVVVEKSISGITRKPKREVIAGSKSTKTIHTEHGCKYFLDVKEMMWSKGNKSEKQRLVKEVKQGEVIVDMFAGLGFFTILLAKTKIKKIYAIDINHKAIEYLEKNIWLNNVEDKVEPILGDSKKVASLLENTADRILMGYFFEIDTFLPVAFKMLKNKGKIRSPDSHGPTCASWLIGGGPVRTLLQVTWEGAKWARTSVCAETRSVPIGPL